MAEPKIAFNIWAVPAGPTAALALTAPAGQAHDLVWGLQLNCSSHMAGLLHSTPGSLRFCFESYRPRGPAVTQTKPHAQDI